MRKRFLMITTALCLTLTAFTGCGKNTDTQSAAQSGTEDGGVYSSTEDSNKQTNSADSALDGDETEKNETGMHMIVDTDKKKAAVKIPEGLYNEKDMKSEDS